MFKNNKGFTLIEIIAVVVLIGIISILGISGVSHLISKSKKDYDNQLRKTLLMAGQNYYAANKDKLPKNIGNTNTVTAEVLKEKKFLKENLKNSKGQSCMENSIVNVHKTSKNDFKYSAELYCGDETAEVYTDNIPIINISFTDREGNIIDSNVPNPNIYDAIMHIEINGGGKSKITGEYLTVEGYAFSISTKVNETDEYINEYNSGTLSGNFQEDIRIDKNISEYIDIKGNNYILVTVTATNSSGETITKDSNGNMIYDNTILPKCESDIIVNPTITDNEWINAEEYKDGIVRKATATCNKNGGVGCLKDKFTKSWPNKYQKEGIYGFIQVKDKLGYTNISNDFLNRNLCDINNDTDSCKVRINIDAIYPKIKIRAYQRTASNTTTGTNILKNGEVQAGGTDTKPTEELIGYNDYKSLVNNGLDYQNGVIYKVELSDNMKVKSWKWETNPENIKDTDLNYSKYGSGYGPSDEQASGSYPTSTLNSCDKNNTKNNITIAFIKKGMRKGRLTIEDIAGNETVLYIEVNLELKILPKLKIGDYVVVVPDKSTYTVSSSLTGNDSNQDIKPNELTLWQIIDINNDGSYDAISEYTSSDGVCFKGMKGYTNFVDTLQTIAAQYKKEGYTTKARIFGYNGQTLRISNQSAYNGSTNNPLSTTTTPDPDTGNGQEYSGGVFGDTLYLKDLKLVQYVDGTTGSRLKNTKIVNTRTEGTFWVCSRKYEYSVTAGKNKLLFGGRMASHNINFWPTLNVLRYYDGEFKKWYERKSDTCYKIRPIITLNANVEIASGSGTKLDPYYLE